MKLFLVRVASSRSVFWHVHRMTQLYYYFSVKSQNAWHFGSLSVCWVSHMGILVCFARSGLSAGEGNWKLKGHCLPACLPMSSSLSLPFPLCPALCPHPFFTVLSNGQYCAFMCKPGRIFALKEGNGLLKPGSNLGSAIELLRDLG